MSVCPHVDSGCNYPEGDCLGLCDVDSGKSAPLIVLPVKYNFVVKQKEQDAARINNH